MEQFGAFLEKLISEHTEYGIFIVIAIFTLELVGLILDWDWVLEPGGGYLNEAYWCEKIGRKKVRIVLGIITSVAILAMLGLYFMFAR